MRENLRGETEKLLSLRLRYLHEATHGALVNSSQLKVEVFKLRLLMNSSQRGVSNKALESGLRLKALSFYSTKLQEETQFLLVETSITGSTSHSQILSICWSASLNALQSFCV